MNLAHVRICGGCCRGSDTPAFSLTVPRQPLKRQIKQLHPSCSSGELKGLSKKGILRIEAILAFFCQVLWSAPCLPGIVQLLEDCIIEPGC